MAEPIGVASGLLALATFAFQSSVTLYTTVQSFQSHIKRVRDLVEELEALTGVLESLTETVAATTDVDFSALKLPLKRCGSSCKEFEQELVKCSSRAGAHRTSFRDWARLRYMGDDIDGFRRLLAGYKLTISIALTDANLRKSSITGQSLDDYQDLVKNATAELEAHLEDIDAKLENVLQQTVPKSSADASELQLIEEERLSTRQCLQICAQLADHISKIQFIPRGSQAPTETGNAETFAQNVTNLGLQECRNSLSTAATKLETHMLHLMDRLVAKTKGAITSGDDVTDLKRLRDEWETARQCLDVCSTADRNFKEKVSIVENYAVGDAVQFMVSTDGNIIHGKNRGLGWRTRQVGGHLSDAAVQNISRDMVSMNKRHTQNEEASSRGDTPSTPAAEEGAGSDFQGRYGRGVQLESKTTPGAARPSTSPAGGR